ncbi:hypothetical protein ACQP1W_21335 [Spirillospora sp. CA-255316]
MKDLKADALEATVQPACAVEAGELQMSDAVQTDRAPVTKLLSLTTTYDAGAT